MAALSSVVIKVKYGDMLRRFNAQILDDKLMLNMNGLREKIHSLFGFASDAELTLTYVDEDDDVVALVDDDDLRDVVKQGLNPLRITVKVNGERSASQDNDSSASSTPLRSPGVKQPLPNLNAGISEILSKVPEPLRDTLVKLSDDLASKASSSAPGISEIVDAISKMSLSYLSMPSESQTGVRSGVPESGTSATGSKDCKVSQKLGVEANVESSEVKSNNPTGQSKKKASSFDFNPVAAALDKQKENVPNLSPGNPESVPLLYSNLLRRKEKLKKHLPSSVNKSLTIGEAIDASQPKLLANSASVKLLANSASVNDTVSNGKSPASIWGPPHGASYFGSPVGRYECPFSGTALENVPAFLPVPAPDQVLFRGNTSQNDGNANVFHRGVRCDGCGIHPIVGPRFKSKVKADYDLCRICFEEMGSSNDYVRMDRPVALQPMSLKGLHDVGRARYHSMPHVFRGPKCKGAIKLDSRFIQDVNIFDGTVMAPLTPFTKIWRMRNNGTLTWPAKTQLIWIGGDKLSNAVSVEVQIPPAGLLIDQELDVAVDFKSPELPGRYISYWRMASPSGQKFGQRVWVLIQVDASAKEMPRETVRNLNLNLPPVSSSLTGPEIINVDAEPMVEDSHPVANSPKKTVELGKSDTDQELKFPINDSLLVGNGASTSAASSSASPSVSYPIIDLSDVPPPLPSVSPATVFPLPPPPPPPMAFGSKVRSGFELPEKDLVEEKLLRELEEMGFKQVDLNKEVLRMNEYDLEQSVDDLCGVAEWDPILEELQEMGFKDTEVNKKLLKKNGGSIKRVVMDLIAGEE